MSGISTISYLPTVAGIGCLTTAMCGRHLASGAAGALIRTATGSGLIADGPGYPATTGVGRPSTTAAGDMPAIADGSGSREPFGDLPGYPGELGDRVRVMSAGLPCLLRPYGVLA